MLRRYYGKISKLPIDQFTGHDGELVVDDLTGRTYVMDGVTLGGHELVGATPRYETSPPTDSIPGALWYDPNSGRLFIYYNSQWVDAAPNTTYTLPIANADELGGIKVGNNLSIDEFGVLSAEDGNYILPIANNTVLGGVKVDNVSILINGSGVISANTTSIQSNIALLFSNADIQASNIATLFSNALTQAASINTINANVAAANLSIANKNTLTNNGKTLTFTNGNLILPSEGNITSTSGNVHIIGNAYANNFTTPRGSNAGYRFANVTTGDDRTGIFHFNLANQLVLQHEGNIGVKVDANGTTEITNLNSKNINSANIYSGNVSVGNITANLISIGTGVTKGYRFYDPSSGFTTSALIHNSQYNQLQLVHESNIGLAILVNGNTIVSNTFTFGTNGTITIPNNGVINYSNGQSILNGITGGGTTNTQPSSTPPASPNNGQLWYDTNSGKIYVYLTDAWIDTNPYLNNNYGDSNVAAYLPTDNTIISIIDNALVQENYINFILGNLISLPTINSLRANINAANAAIVTANVGMKSYADYISTSWKANAATQAVSINSILANLSSQTGNSLVQQNTIDYLLANTITQQANIISLRANINAANGAIVTANVGMKSYVDSVTASWIANAEIQSAQIGNIYANLSSQVGNSLVQQNTIDYLLANTIAQQANISSLRANINAANSIISTKTVYSNSNVAAYLPTYSGSIGGTITVGALLQAPQYSKASNATGTVGQICWDSNYIYVCTATNTWKRVALTGGY
jgi:hypothetical protein